MSKTPKVTKMWTQRDGTKIRICDMSDRHLINTIKMLERNALREEHSLVGALGYIGGEMAEMDFDNMMWGDIEDGPLTFFHPLYDDLVLDAERRGLKV